SPPEGWFPQFRNIGSIPTGTTALSDRCTHEMAEVFEKTYLKETFEQIVKDCGGCEDINDGYDTAPSKRIQ
ncbi:MAG: hypothetical protein JXA46_12195, partial [Dehalococcoidales bacterium]|nr:hypothetical protein [Dehalococcoidales bacterium]